MDSRNSREKFVELAEKRVVRSIKDIRLIGNLANRNNYDYTEKDVKKIINALGDEIKSLKSRFETKKESQEIVFKLE